MAKINKNSGESIFRSITSHKNHQHITLRKKNVPLSYTRARELLLDVVTAVGLEREVFLLHSLRSGGASAIANAGVSDRLFKKPWTMAFRKRKGWLYRRQHGDIVSCIKDVGFINDNNAPTLNSHALR